MYLLALPVLLVVVLFVLWKMPAKSGGGSVVPNFLATATTPFQQNLDEEAQFLVEAYRENAMAEKRAEVAAKASKYFTKSE